MRLLNIILFFLLISFSHPLAADFPTKDQHPTTENKEISPPKYFNEAPTPPPPSYDEDRFWRELINMFLTLAFIVAILIALTWIMRRMQTTRVKFANESSVIKVVDHRSLSAKSAIYLLHIHDRAVVVADSQNGTTRLADFPIEGNSETSTITAPQSKFEKFIQDKKNL